MAHELLLYRRNEEKTYNDRMRSYQISKYTEDEPSYSAAAFGKATFFRITQETMLLFVKTFIKQDTNYGKAVIKFRLFSLMAAAGEGTAFHLIKDVLVIREDYKIGVKIIYAGINEKLTPGDYCIVPELVSTDTKGIFEMVKSTYSAMTDSDYMEAIPDFRSSNVTIDEIGAYHQGTELDYITAHAFFCDEYDLTRYDRPNGIDNDFHLKGGMGPIGDVWLVYHSAGLSKDEKSGFRLIKSFNSPGQIEFSKTAYVPTQPNGLSGESKVTFKIDGIEKMTWKGSQPWQKFQYFVAAGIHSSEWIFEEELDAGGSTASIGEISCYEFILLACDITDYSPVSPKLLTNTVEILRGYDLFSRASYGGSLISFTSIIYTNLNYLDFITNIDKIHIFVDEHGLIYGGIFQFDDDMGIKKIGVNNIYYVPLNMRCAQKAGVGS